jgi:hypothetical protein
MNHNFNDLTKKIDNQGQLFTCQNKDLNNGVKETWCSTYIPKKQTLIKGECHNQKSESRNAMMVLHDVANCKVIGKDILLVCGDSGQRVGVIIRHCTDNQQGAYLVHGEF